MALSVPRIQQGETGPIPWDVKDSLDLNGAVSVQVRLEKPNPADPASHISETPTTVVTDPTNAVGTFTATASTFAVPGEYVIQVVATYSDRIRRTWPVRFVVNEAAKLVSTKTASVDAQLS